MLEVDTNAELVAQRDGYTAVQIPEAILCKVGRVARPIAVERRGIAMVGHADDDSRSLADCLWQQGKRDGAFLLFKIDVCDLVIILRNQARLARQDVRDVIADAVDLAGEIVLHIVELAAKVIYLRAERVDAVVVMHADGDERGERHGRTADDLLVLRAEGAKIRLCRGRTLGSDLRCALGGGSGGGAVLRFLGVLKAQKRVDGDLIDLAQLDELWKLRLRGAGFP